MPFATSGDIGGSLGMSIDLRGDMSIGGNDLSMGYAFGMSDGIKRFYEGPYVVTPKVGEQYLDTDLRAMHEDVTIKPIPYWEVSNPSGGTTVIIGEV